MSATDSVENAATLRDDGRDHETELVDEPGIDELRRESRTSLAEHAVQLSRAESVDRLRQINPTVVVGENDDVDRQVSY